MRRLFSVFLLSIAVFLSGCIEGQLDKAYLKPISSRTKALMEQKGMTADDPVLVRIFKADSVLEIWKQPQGQGAYQLLRSYEICRWSGDLGPKFKEGDRQAPEGFYTLTVSQLNPNSNYHLAFNIGFPNRFDSAHGRTGSHLMVHGDCSSRGCYAMEDDQIEDIYAVVREAFIGGQKAIPIHALPFRMTEENLAAFQGSPHEAFWQNLAEGDLHFQATGVPPKVDVCGKKYVFNASSDLGFNENSACPPYSIDEQVVAALEAYKVRQQEEALQMSLPKISLPLPTKISKAEAFQTYLSQKNKGDEHYKTWRQKLKPYMDPTAPEAFSLVALKRPEAFQD